MALTDDCLLYTGNEKAWPFRDIAEPCPRGHNLEVEGDNGGPLYADRAPQQVESRGVAVEYNARALTLIADAATRCIGLVVRIDGEETQRPCAQGGDPLRRRLRDESRHAREVHARRSPRSANVPVGNPGDTARGILMGQGVGGATAPHERELRHASLLPARRRSPSASSSTPRLSASSTKTSITRASRPPRPPQLAATAST